MSAEARKRILARVRGAARGAGAEAIARQLAQLGSAPAGRQLHPGTLENFLANVLRNQGTVALATDRREAVNCVGQYLYQQLRSQRLVAANEPHLAAMPWREAKLLPRFGEISAGEKAALSYADWGIAECGAVVLTASRYNPPPNHLLPEHHIVILEAEKVLPDLESYWRQQQWRRGQRPRGIGFIAGPSSTGDIEAQLVYGAHGPRAWHVVVLGKVAAKTLETARQLAQLPGTGD